MQKKVCSCLCVCVGGVQSGKGRLVRMVVNEEFKLFWKCKNKKKSGGGGQVGCERRIEVIVQCKKKERNKVGGGSGFGGTGSGWM